MGVKVDYWTVWNFVHAEGLSFKKVCCQPSRTGPTWRADGPVEEVSGPD